MVRDTGGEASIPSLNVDYYGSSRGGSACKASSINGSTTADGPNVDQVEEDR